MSRRTRRMDRRRKHYLREVGIPVSVGPPTCGRCPQSGKLRYLDQETADRAVAWMQRQVRSSAPVPTRSYRCRLPHCGAWHITSQPVQRELA